MYLKKLETILLSKVDPDSEPELIDEDDSFYELTFDNLPYSSISDKVKYIRDSLVKKSELINLLLDPSQMQLLYVIRCEDHEVLQTIKEFMKLQMEKEVTTIPQTIDNYVH